MDSLRPALSSALSLLSRCSFTDLVAYTVLGAAALSLLSLARVYTSDADLTVLAALRRLPAKAFAGKTVWIVGASSGIGEALALEVSRRGAAAVVLSARRVDRLEGVRRACEAAGAGKVHVLPLDVEAFATHADAVKEVVQRVGRIDFLVNNAGRSQRGLVERTDLQVAMDMFKLNVFGVMSITQAALPALLAQPGGAVLVTTSSVAGKLGSPISAFYSSSKHALQGFFDSLRMEMGGRNIRVVNICPGPVQSEITLHAFTEAAGKEHGKQETGTTRMSAERCAELMAAAMYAELPESWMAPQPILLFTYVAQYWRGLYFAMGPGAGRKRVEAFKKGDSGYGSLQGGVFSIATAAKTGATKAE
jgi:dehydrogenase/reductase SDR family protein 7